MTDFYLQHGIVEFSLWFVHPMDSWVQEKGMIAYTRKEHFHNKSPVIKQRDSRGLKVHCEICHVGLKLSKGLFALALHIVL